MGSGSGWNRGGNGSWNTWIHIAVVFNGATSVTNYINGTAGGWDLATVPNITGANTSNVAYVGGAGGKIATLQVYNTVLTQAQIKQNCLAQEHRFTATAQSICGAP